MLDCSVALTWCLPGQGTPAADRLLEYAWLEGAVVPQIWHFEVSNIVGLKLRDGNLSEGDAQQGLGLLNKLDIVTDRQLPPTDIATSIGNIIRFQLAAYDALTRNLRCGPAYRWLPSTRP